MRMAAMVGVVSCGALMACRGTEVPAPTTPVAVLRIVLERQPPAQARNGLRMDSTIIQLQDLAGRPSLTANREVVVRLDAGVGTLTGTLSRATDAMGRAIFDDLVLGGTVGARVLAFEMSGSSAITARPIDLRAGAPARLVATGVLPEAAAGTTLPARIAIRAEDASGNGVPGVVLMYTPVSGGGSLSQLEDTTDVTGTARGPTWTLGDEVGMQPLRISAGTLSVDLQARARGLIASALSVGASHVCVLEPGGRARCWGGNLSGELGDGTIDDRDRAGPVLGGHSFSAVSALFLNTCGVTGAALYCWGWQARVGNGVSSGNATSPVRVTLPGPVRSVAGNYNVCAILMDDSAWCWGDNQHGTLGDGTRVSSDIPRRVLVPPVRSIAVAPWHACALDDAGRARCWGLNSGGQLGDGTTTIRTVPIEVAGNVRFSQLALGGAHTCGLATDGVAWCWGANAVGQAGIGSTDPAVRLPTRVQTSQRFVSITAGGNHTCGVDTSGDAWCWGWNETSQLGLAVVPDGQVVTIPGRVAGGLKWQQVGAGSYHSCGLTRENEVWCWGSDYSGVLGNGRRGESGTPVGVLP